MDTTDILSLLNGSKKTVTNFKEKQSMLLENAEKECIHEKICAPKPKEFNYDSNQPFDIGLFEQELKQLSEVKNQVYARLAKYINAYDIAANCIRQVVYKLTGTPVSSFADNWLPVILRSTIGSAIHDFIQSNTGQFTETECSIKVPSINFSGRIDALIGDSILVEIKSVPYNDYHKILKSKKPRQADFLQTLVYKYILENHLKEAQTTTEPLRTAPPKLEQYNIKTIQYIYVAHDLCAADVEDFNELLAVTQKVKKLLNSRVNRFYFIMSLVVPVNNDKVMKQIDFIKSKIAAINNYLKTNTLPNINDPFIDKNKCYFCQYNKICELHCKR